MIRHQHWITALLLLGIVVCANILAKTQMRGRADLTVDGRFTLAEGSRELVASLEDRLLVQAFITEDLPANLVRFREQSLDLLAEYEAEGGGRIKVEMKDPDPQRNLRVEQEAIKKGIRAVSAVEQRRGRRESRTVFLGAVLQYGDSEVVLPTFDFGNLEYQMSSAIRDLVRPARPKIGFFTRESPAPPEIEGFTLPMPPDRIFRQARERLKGTYRVEDVVLKAGQPVPDDVDVLVVIRPWDLTDREMFAIDQFVMGGGRLFLVTDRVPMNLGSGGPAPGGEVRWDAWLGSYGAAIGDSLVFDLQCLSARFPGPERRSGNMVQRMPDVRGDFPFFVSVKGAGFNREHLATRHAEDLSLFWAHPVRVSSSLPPGVSSDVLVVSSKDSWLEADTANSVVDLDVFRRTRARLLGGGPGRNEDLARTFTGIFPSFFAGRERPAMPPPPEGRPAPTDPFEGVEQQVESPETRIVVVGDADWLADPLLRALGQDASSRRAPNLELFENLVDWLTQADGLIAIRSRGASAPPLDHSVREEQRRVFQARLRESLPPGIPPDVIGMFASTGDPADLQIQLVDGTMHAWTDVAADVVAALDAEMGDLLSEDEAALLADRPGVVIGVYQGAIERASQEFEVGRELSARWLNVAGGPVLAILISAGAVLRRRSRRALV